MFEILLPSLAIRIWAVVSLPDQTLVVVGRVFFSLSLYTPQPRAPARLVFRGIAIKYN